MAVAKRDEEQGNDVKLEKVVGLEGGVGDAQ